MKVYWTPDGGRERRVDRTRAVVLRPRHAGAVGVGATPMKKSDVRVGATYLVKPSGVAYVVRVERVRGSELRPIYDVLDEKSGRREQLAVAAFLEEVRDVRAGDLVTVRDGTQVYKVESVSGNVVKTAGGPTVTRAFVRPLVTAKEPPPVATVKRLDSSTSVLPKSTVKPAPAPEPPVTPSAAPAQQDGGESVTLRPTAGDPAAIKALFDPLHLPREGEEGRPPSAGVAPSAAGAGLKPTTSRQAGGSGASRPSALSGLFASPGKGHSLAPHLVAVARAGTGKTTTMVQGVRGVLGLDPRVISKDNRDVGFIEPSDQQAAIWEAMAAGERPKSVCFCAFNKPIAEELKKRVPRGCDASTMHGLGFKAVSRAWGLRGDNVVNQYRVGDLIGRLLGKEPKEVRTKTPALYNCVTALVSLVKMNLTPLDVGPEEELAKLAAHYDVELFDEREGDVTGRVFDLVPRVIRECLKNEGTIDFDDMVWLPVALDLSVYRYGLLLVDEAQDLNKCQHALVKKAGERLVLCGDERQAIYGFAGADSQSLPRMTEYLKTTPAGVNVLPLTVTRRCGRAIVREANRLVSDFSAHPSNPDGKISRERYEAETGSGVKTYHERVEDGDMVLCRVNAPLVSQCFKFLKMGRKANIQGRNVGQGLISLITKIGATSVPELIGKMDEWYRKECEKEHARTNPSEQRLIALADKHDCLTSFTEGADTIEAVVKKIDGVFTDVAGTGIRLSSIHKSKGLEAGRVFLLMPEGAEIPHPMAKSKWQRDQEDNLKYVAITRAINELVYVT